jgi:hypothetical protein
MAVAALASLPFVVIAVSAGQLPPPWLELADVALGPDDPTLAPIITTLEDHPVATTTLALLLRGQSRRTVADGLVAESAAYSVLQSGPARSARPASPARGCGWSGRRPACASP